MKLPTLITLLFLATAVFADSEAPSIPTQTVSSPVMASTISGKVMIRDNTPMAHGVVLLFNKSMGAPPDPYKYWRVPDLISGTDKAGEFSLKVPEGTYYLMVAQKKPDSEIGPPNEKEFVYFHGDAEGNPLPLVVTLDTKINLGVLTTSFEWSPELVQREQGITAVEGVVSDMDGKPVEKAVVFAYLTEDTKGKPAFVSDRTDKNGKYLLRVHGGGSYYLKVRSVIGGGKPQEGEFNNVTPEFEPVMVTLTKDKKLKGIALKVNRFSKQGRKGPVNPKAIKNGIPKEKSY